jgi:hypothetical protein
MMHEIVTAVLAAFLAGWVCSLVVIGIALGRDGRRAVREARRYR